MLMNVRPNLRTCLALAAIFCALPVFPAAIYVNLNANGANNGTSWADAFYNLHDALAAARYGDEIWVAEGIYFPHPGTPVNRDASFEIPNGVKLYGGFSGTEQSREERDWVSHPAILSGANGLNPDTLNDAYTVVYLEHCDASTLIDGFTIREGLANSASINDSYIGRRKNGGAVYIYAAGAGNSATPVFVNCTFVANKASERGGAVMGIGTNGGYVCPQFRACTWQQNTAGSNGGAFYIQNQEGENATGAVFRLDSCQVLLNNIGEHTALRIAGGVFSSTANGNRAIVEDCFFFGNGKAGSSGAHALSISSPYTPLEAEIHNCRFVNNQGGAGLVSQRGEGTILVTGCEFVGNGGQNVENALPPLAFHGASIMVRNCSFTGNIARNGAGISMGGHSSGAISGCTFRNNTCNNIGSALLFSNENTLLIRDCRFEENNAAFGGAVAFREQDNSVDFVNCIFSRNHSGWYGGAIYNYHVAGSRMQYINCLFYRNTARYGGLCYADGTDHELSFHNSILYRNLSSNLNTPVLLSNTPINLNHCLMDVESCDQLAVADSSFVYAYYEEGNPADSFLLSTNLNANCNGMRFGASPMFVDTAAADFHLLPASPAVNAGLNSILDSVGLQYDLDGNPRISGGVVDIGPYELPLDPVFNALLSTVDPVSCYNGSDGAVHFLVTGQPPFQYSWENGEEAGYGTAGLYAGLYNFTISDAAGNSRVVENIEVGQPPALILPIDVSGISCTGAADGAIRALVFGGAPPYSFMWNTGLTDSALTGLAAGQYAVTVTDANGCAKTGSVNLAGPDPFSVSAMVRHPSCGALADGSISLSISGATPPYSVFWSNGQNGPVLTGLNEGGYQAIVVDANGCRDSLLAGLEAPPILAAVVEAMEPSCYGLSDGQLTAEASGGVPPWSFAWSNGVEGPEATGLSAGTYRLSLTDADGCFFETAMALDQPDSLFAGYTIIPPSSNGASDGAIILGSVFGGTPSFTYAWGTGASTPSIENLPVGDYELTITDANGCQAYYAFELSPATGQREPAAPGSVRLFPNPSSGNEHATLEWPENWGAPSRIEAFTAAGARLGSVRAEALTAGRSLLNPPAAGACFLKVYFGKGQAASLKWIVLPE